MALPSYSPRNKDGYDISQVFHGSSGNAITLTATSNGSVVKVGENKRIDVVADVTGTVSGTTPTLDLVVQSATDAAFTTPVVEATFTRATATSYSERQTVVCQNQYVRVVATVGGITPSFGGVLVRMAS